MIAVSDRRVVVVVITVSDRRAGIVSGLQSIIRAVSVIWAVAVVLI